MIHHPLTYAATNAGERAQQCHPEAKHPKNQRALLRAESIQKSKDPHFALEPPQIEPQITNVILSEGCSPGA
jgi:hypothetical protein